MWEHWNCDKSLVYRFLEYIHNWEREAENNTKFNITRICVVGREVVKYAINTYVPSLLSSTIHLMKRKLVLELCYLLISVEITGERTGLKGSLVDPKMTFQQIESTMWFPPCSGCFNLKMFFFTVNNVFHASDWQVVFNALYVKDNHLEP